MLVRPCKSRAPWQSAPRTAPQRGHGRHARRSADRLAQWLQWLSWWCQGRCLWQALHCCCLLHGTCMLPCDGLVRRARAWHAPAPIGRVCALQRTAAVVAASLLVCNWRSASHALLPNLPKCGVRTGELWTKFNLPSVDCHYASLQPRQRCRPCSLPRRLAVQRWQLRNPAQPCIQLQTTSSLETSWWCWSC